ncbi:hypothetical protein, partial [Streptomyces sp. NPDC057910]|uniref:hypothetical protein n=1 Tax=Streptomyces sp. NPDC057910 TaxID=3346278 RepID=UPI0036E0889C
VALNLIRLDAWWNGQPLDHTRTSHLARLDLTPHLASRIREASSAGERLTPMEGPALMTLIAPPQAPAGRGPWRR